MSLITTTRNFAKAYTAFKEAEKVKETERKKFFEALDKDLATSVQPQRTIGVPYIDDENLMDADQLKHWIAIYYPGWKPISIKGSIAIIERDPSFIKHSVVVDGMVWGREIGNKAPTLDEERLKAQDPDLWEQVSVPARVIKDSKEWSIDEAEALREYLIPGALQAKIAPPRPEKK